MVRLRRSRGGERGPGRLQGQVGHPNAHPDPLPRAPGARPSWRVPGRPRPGLAAPGRTACLASHTAWRHSFRRRLDLPIPMNTAAAAPTRERRTLPAIPRRHALLGGTTTMRDVRTAVRYLGVPRDLADGPAIGEFERSFAAHVGARHAVSFAAGRVGLYGILRCLGVGAGDEVLVPVPTHVVVANAVRYTGGRPIYVDCDLSTYGIDLDQAERHLTARTRAMLVQHTFGIPVAMADAIAFADRHGLLLIED